MLRATIRITAGIVLLIIGIIGLLVPIMPQWPFIIPGLLLLGDYFPPAKRLHGYIMSKIEWGKQKAGFKKPPA